MLGFQYHKNNKAIPFKQKITWLALLKGTTHMHKHTHNIWGGWARLAVKFRGNLSSYKLGEDEIPYSSCSTGNQRINSRFTMALTRKRFLGTSTTLSIEIR